MKKTTQRLVINLPSEVGARLRQTARAQGLTVSQVVLRSVRRDPLLLNGRARHRNLTGIVRGNSTTKAEVDEWDNLLAEQRPVPPPTPVKYRDLSGLVAKKGEIDFKAWRKSIAEMDVIHPDDWK